MTMAVMVMVVPMIMVMGVIVRRVCVIVRHAPPLALRPGQRKP